MWSESLHQSCRCKGLFPSHPPQKIFVFVMMDFENLPKKLVPTLDPFEECRKKKGGGGAIHRIDPPEKIGHEKFSHCPLWLDEASGSSLPSMAAKHTPLRRPCHTLMSHHWIEVASLLQLVLIHVPSSTTSMCSSTTILRCHFAGSHPKWLMPSIMEPGE